MNFDVKVYEWKPVDFVPQVEVSAIYVIFHNNLLLLKLSANKKEAGAWGVPAGKLEKEESCLICAKRELAEETGIDLSENSFREQGKLYIRKPEIDYVYHLLSVNLECKPKIHLSQEHDAYQWVSRQEALNMPLMKGGKEALEFFYLISETHDHSHKFNL